MPPACRRRRGNPSRLAIATLIRLPSSLARPAPLLTRLAGRVDAGRAATAAPAPVKLYDRAQHREHAATVHGAGCSRPSRRADSGGQRPAQQQSRLQVIQDRGRRSVAVWSGRAASSLHRLGSCRRRPLTANTWRAASFDAFLLYSTCRPVPLGKGMGSPAAPQPLRRMRAAVVPKAAHGEGKDAPAGEVRHGC